MGLKDLVTKTGYSSIFRDAAVALAPSKESSMVLRIRWARFDEHIEACWKHALGESHEQPTDSAKRFCLKVLPRQ